MEKEENMKQKIKFNRLFSGVLSAVMTISAVPVVSVNAEESTEPYPYTMFAASTDDGAITINADNFSVNGNVATNGTIVSSGNININGTRSESTEESMIFIFDKIDNQYFSASNVDEHDEDYILDEMNININVPTEVQGEATLTGNINVNTAFKALKDVNLYGEVKNTNDSVIFSKYGDISIDSSNVNLNGLVYAPFGSVNITAQNLNLNNVVIIAESIVLTCPNVNANNSSNASNFVGNTSEPMDIPYDEWRYMKDENENDFPDFFEDYDNWVILKDTDGDRLPDCVEQFLGTDATLADTDGDMLDDYYEAFVTGTDPTLTDTDSNGVADGNEDFDNDGLTNYQEYVQGTSPWDSDSDSDNLSDGDEVNTYGTNPLEPDTDFDGLSDADEIALGTNPNLADTDGDRTPDCEERFDQTYVYDVENKDCAVEQVIVSMEGTGNLQSTMSVKSVMDKDTLCSGVVGLIGEPFSIKTTSEFEKATITFKINKSKLGETDFENLMFLWYDEENKEFVDLESEIDTENSLISVETTHFSKYMVVDKLAWFKNWRDIYNSYYNVLSSVPSKTAICVDCSGSMSTNDPITIIPPSSAPYRPIYDCERHKAVSYFTNTAYDNDKASIITFDNTAQTICDMTKEKSDLYWASTSFYNNGGTNSNAAIDIAIDQLKNESGNRSIILLSDGDVNVSQSNLDLAVSYNIKIHTIGLGTGANNYNLVKYSNKTGGTHFASVTANELREIYESLSYMRKTDFSFMTDSDDDGLPDDMEEILGIPLPNGQLVFTDPENPDTDGDDLSDGEEVDYSLYLQKLYDLFIEEDDKHLVAFMFKPTSDPTNPDSDDDGLNDYDELVNVTDAFNDDTDDDGINDYYDPYPLEYNDGDVYNRQAVVEYAMYWGQENMFNPAYHTDKDGFDCANFVSQCLYTGGYLSDDDWFNKKEYDTEVNFAMKAWLKSKDQYTEDGWIWTGTWKEASKLKEKYSKAKYSTGSTTITESNFDNIVTNKSMREGDLIFFYVEGNPEAYHSAIISDLKDGEIYFAAHTTHRTRAPLSPTLFNYEKVVIVHMRDYLPKIS